MQLQKRHSTSMAKKCNTPLPSKDRKLKSANNPHAEDNIQLQQQQYERKMRFLNKNIKSHNGVRCVVVKSNPLPLPKGKNVDDTDKSKNTCQNGDTAPPEDSTQECPLELIHKTLEQLDHSGISQSNSEDEQAWETLVNGYCNGLKNSMSLVMENYHQKRLTRTQMLEKKKKIWMLATDFSLAAYFSDDEFECFVDNYIRGPKKCLLLRWTHLACKMLWQPPKVEQNNTLLQKTKGACSAAYPHSRSYTDINVNELNHDKQPSFMDNICSCSCNMLARVLAPISTKLA